jgi:hypothetical protein
MKWIKLFEGFESGDYYRQLTHREFLDKLGEIETNKERITDDEVNQLDKVIEDNLGLNHRMVTFNSFIISNPKYSLDIWKMKDEWFLVRWVVENQRTGRIDNYEYYLCDQFEGLIEKIKSFR